MELARFAIGRGSHASPSMTRRFRLPLTVMRRMWPIVPFPRVERLCGPVDLVHVTDLVPPPTRRPLVLTVHDLDAVAHPELHSRRARSLQVAQLAAARRHADLVIANSATTARALNAHGVDPERIRVVHLAGAELPAPDPRLVPDAPYFLAVGTLDARKGLDVLIDAFSRAGLDGVRLVLAGPDGHRAEMVRAAAEACGAADQILVAGRVTDAELAALYRGALAYCLPSRAEGFGLPALEAMSAGAPVIASDLPVVREIVGRAGRIVPVGSVPAWIEALEVLAGDDATRARMSLEGRVVSERFTWSATAKATVAVYEEVIAGHPGRRA